jgi:hypothetical protein
VSTKAAIALGSVGGRLSVGGGTSFSTGGLERIGTADAHGMIPANATEAPKNDLRRRNIAGGELISSDIITE